MPWCHDCDRFYNPNSLRGDGTCPTGHQVAELAGIDEASAAGEQKAPWHFKVLLAGVVGYLGWRLVQGIEWVVHHV